MVLGAQMSLGEDSTTNADQDKRWRHLSVVSSQCLRERTWLTLRVTRVMAWVQNWTLETKGELLCMYEKSFSSSGVHMGTVHFYVAEGTVFHPQAFVSSQWERTVTSQCSRLRGSRKSLMHPVCQGKAHTCGNLRPSSNSSGIRALKFQVGRQIAVHALWVSCPLGTRVF